MSKIKINFLSLLLYLILFPYINCTDRTESFENKMQKLKKSNSDLPKGGITFKRPLLYKEIEDYIEALPSRNTPYRKISLEVIGQSFEKRNITLVKIEHPESVGTVLFEAGIHGREWISSMTALYVIDRVSLSYHIDDVNAVNWYIIPCMNPDGFIESQKNNSMQRKNKNYSICPKKDCEGCGVDLNRNFPFKWKRINDPCSEIYSGTRPLSEPESSALAQTLTRYKDQILLYVALHSYLCSFLYPWGYTKKRVDDYRDLERAANGSVNLMNQFERQTCQYTIQHSGSLVPGGGGSDDYAKGFLRIKYVYTLELQGCGDDGFHPYNREVSSMVEQNYIGLKALSTYVARISKKVYTKERTKPTTAPVSASDTIILYSTVFWCYIIILNLL